MAFTEKIVNKFKRSRRARGSKKVDIVSEQVKDLLQTSDQQLIQMVRG